MTGCFRRFLYDHLPLEWDIQDTGIAGKSEKYSKSTYLSNEKYFMYFSVVIQKQTQITIFKGTELAEHYQLIINLENVLFTFTRFSQQCTVVTFLFIKTDHKHLFILYLKMISGFNC